MKSVKVIGFDSVGSKTYEVATLARVTRQMLPLPIGYVPVRFSDGARLLVHTSRIVS